MDILGQTGNLANDWMTCLVSGRRVIYDYREGAYYDPETDMHLTWEQWKRENGILAPTPVSAEET